MSEQFRRTDPRYQRRLEVEILVEGRRQTAVTRNVSLGGMFVEMDSAVPMGAEVQVRFRVPSQPESIEVAGDVRWVEPMGELVGVGIRFQGLRARDVWALNRFFSV